MIISIGNIKLTDSLPYLINEIIYKLFIYFINENYQGAI